MKQNNLKKLNLSVKKPSAKRVTLKSSKESEKLKATTPRPSLVRRGMGRSMRGMGRSMRGMGRWFRSLKFGFRIYRVAGLFVLFAILGFTVWQALLPQSARSKTFTMMQDAWSIVAATVNLGECDSDPNCTESGDQRNVTAYASKDAQISVTPDTAVTLAATAGSKAEGTDTDAFTGIPTNTQVNGSGASASVKLIPSFDNGTGVNGDFDTNTYNDSSITGITGTYPTITINTSSVTNTDSATSPYRDTTVTPNVVVYNFQNFDIRSGHTVNVVGSYPVVIKATGNVTIASTGILNLNGSNGATGAGAAAGAGGGAGNIGAAGTGVGPSSVGGGSYSNSVCSGSCSTKGGGGGGYATTGGSNAQSAAGGSSYGTSSINILYGGSGGGSGGDYYNDPFYGNVPRGGGGGGGGGAIKISTKNTITINGTIRANGGSGGPGGYVADDGYGNSKSGGGGGGGAGGSVFLQGNTIDVTGGTVTAAAGNGNANGGNGSVGRIRLDYITTTGSGTVSPAGYTVCPSGCTTASGLYVASGDYTSAVYDTGQKNNFTTAAWTAITTGADTFTHTSDGDFNGTNASTIVSGNSVILMRPDPTIPNSPVKKGFCISGNTDSRCTDFGTAVNLTGGSYYYTSFYIQSGVTVTVPTGGSALIINANDNVVIDGVLQANGGNGVVVTAGAAGAGGSAGGAGNGTFGNGTLGFGNGGGGGGIPVLPDDGAGGGGGGGFGGLGGTGGGSYGATGGSVGPVNGTISNGGSGGGGGSADGSSRRGGGGGGGGGRIQITTNQIITIGSSGFVYANGGTGGSAQTVSGGGGGGGSGGSIKLEASRIVNNNVNASGSLRANGGSGGSVGPTGGGGGGGRILLIDSDGVIEGSGTISRAQGSGGSGATANNEAYTQANPSYASSGIYTSAIKEIGTGEKFKSIAWTETLNGQTIMVKVRTCNDDQCSGEAEFSTLLNIVNDQDYSASLPTGVNNGDGWVQYEATLSGNGSATPTLDSVTITTIPLVLEMRAGPNNTDCPGACTGWTAWTEIGSGATASSSLGATYDTAFDGNQWIQYRANLSTANTAYTPSLDDITFNYTYYPVGEYKLVSSAFNSGDGTNLATNISWSESTNLGTTDVKFQVRTAPNNDNGTLLDASDDTAIWASGSKWCGPSSCAANTDITSYADSYYNTTPAGESLKGDHSTGDNDQWIQYIAFLSTTEGNATPTLSDITLQYVINSPAVISGVTASAQDATGKSTIQYTIYDQEEGGTDNRLETYYFYDAGTTLSGALAASAVGTITLTNSTVGILEKIPTTGYLLIDNEIVQYNNRQSVQGVGPYTVQLDIISGGRGKWVSGTAGYSTKDVLHNDLSAVWIPIPDSALSSATSPDLHIACGSGVNTCLGTGDPIDANTYSVIWDPNDNFDELYKAGMGVKVMVNDKNAANMVGSSSGTRTIDAKAPGLAGISFFVKDATDDSATATDSRTVKLTVSGITDNSNIELQFSNNGTDWGSATNSTGGISNTGWITGLDSAQTYTNTAWVLPTGNGSKTVYVRVRDQFGNPSATPSSADDASISYNITPEFNADYDNNISGYTCYGAGANGVCIRQLTIADDISNAGKVEIKYQVRDQDTDESFVAPHAPSVNVFFKYSVNGGTNWSYVTNNLSGDGTDNGTNVETALQRLVTVSSDSNNTTLDTTYTTHTTYWDAKTAGIAALDDDFITSSNFKIMAFVDDGESSLSRNGDPASDLGMASDGINIDTKNPATVSVTIDGGATTTSRDVTLTLAQTDNSSVQMQFANTNETTYGTAVNNDGTVTDAGTYENFGTTKSWRVVKGISATKTIYFKVRDIYGNTTTASDTIAYNQTPEFDGTFGTNGIDVYQCQITDTTPCDKGMVRIQYRIRDKDKLDGSANQSTVTALIEYYDGAAYQTAATLAGDTGNLAVETVESDYPTYNPAYKTFTTYWNAKSNFPDEFKNAASNKIRITVNDGESALNTTPGTLSAQYVLDTKNPELGASPFLVNSNSQFTSARPVTLNLSVTEEDSTYYAQYSNNNSTFGAGSDTLGILDSSGLTAAQVTGKYEAYNDTELLWNLFTPTLAAGIDEDDAVIPLSSLANVPSSGWVLIGSERISYSGTSSSADTCGTGITACLTGASRHQADTTAASHTSGAAVEVDGTRTVYNKIFDIYGNGLTPTQSDSIYYDQTPAGVVKKLSIQDASNTLTDDWRLFVSWESLGDTNAALAGDFKWYQVFRCKTSDLTQSNCPVKLSANINDTDQIIPLTDISGFSTSGRINIDSEVISYATSPSSDELICGTGKAPCLTGVTRGFNQTVKTSHSQNAEVYRYLKNALPNTFTLASGITVNPADDIILGDATGFPSAGFILIDNEVIGYTGLSSNTLTGVTRNAKSTTAADHSGGTVIYSLTNNLSNNYFTDDFANESNPNQTKYFYFIRSEDLAGNLAPKSSIVSSVPNGSGGRDTIPVRVYDNVNGSNCSTNTNTGTVTGTAGLLAEGWDDSVNTTSGIDCSTRGTNTATIKWKTYNNSTDVNTGDQDQGKGDSFVEYGTVSGVYPNSAGLHEYAASHSIVLTGLSYNTIYYFRVRSRDGIGNINTTKTDGTGGISQERSFTTRDIDTPIIISTTPSKNSAAIIWSTIDQTNSLIEYWKLSDQTTQAATCNYSNIALNKVKVSGTENEAATSHSVIIAQKLSTSSDYCFRVKSKDTNNNNITGSAVKFTTLGVPTISNARTEAADIQTNTAIVKWSTSDNTTSYLEFWKTGTSSKKTAGIDGSRTSHSVELPDDLLTNTKYYFQIKSKDDADNAITSSNANCTQVDGGGCYFTTNAPPAPGAISAANVGMNKAEISWTTTGGNDSKTNSIAEYVNYDDYNGSDPLLTVWKTAGNDAQALSHNVALPTELAAGTKYFVRVRTRDAKGNSVSNIASAEKCPTGEGNGFDATTGECFFTTKTVPVISQVRVAESLKDKLTITWVTDAAATSIVEYGQNNSYGAIAGDDKTEATNHSVTVDGLTQKTAYHFKVRSFGNTAINQQATKVSNLSETNDFTAETAIDPGDITAPVISGAAVGDTGSASAVITWTTDEPADSQVFYTSSNPVVAGQRLKGVAARIVLGFSHSDVDARTTKPFDYTGSETENRLTGFQKVAGVMTAHAASTSAVNSQQSKVNSFTFNLRLTLSRSLAWTANHMPQVSLVVSFILGAVFAVFAALLLVMANYMRGGWKLRQILKMTPMIVLKDTSSGFCALANSDNQGTWQASFSVYSKHRNITRKTIGTAFALGALKIFLSTSIPVFLLTQASFAAVNYSSTELDSAKNTTHRVELSGLNPATTHWIYVSSADAKGNSANTIANPLFFTTETAPDETAPIISNIQITGITDLETVIAWETDESGDSFVEYGVDMNYGFTAGTIGSRTSHSVKLAGLKDKTAYHFRAKSKDISGNIGQSIDQSFTTSAGASDIPPKISAEGPRVEDLKPISAKILWKTDKPSTSIVAFGKSSSFGTEIGNTVEQVTEHEVALLGLDPNTKYNFKVKSADADGNIGESPDKEFATPEKPIISKVAASEISMISAIVTWETSTSITSEIEYGKTIAYGKNIIDKSLSQTTQHTVKIDGLESGVQYHFRAKGTDQYGSIVQSDDYAFATIAEPKISKFEIESVTHGGAVIVWETNTDTDSLTEYQKDGDADVKTAGATDLTKTHKVKIDKLEDNAKFRARIVGRDALGNEVKSDYKEFLTLADTEAPKVSGVKTESSIPSSGEENVQVLVSWTTDEPGTSQVEYRQGVAIGKNYPLKSRLDVNLTTSHLAVLSGFKTSDIYHFRVLSKDRAGNEGASADYTILTPQKKESLLQIILKNLEESFGFLRKLGK